MKMELFLVRHAEALPAGEAESDETRPLSPRGVARLVAGATGLARLGVRFDRIYHSPLLRAVETAELLTPLLDPEGETIVCPELARPPVPALWEGLAGKRVALVGHEPYLSELFASLVLGWEVLAAEGHEPFSLEKGGVAWISGKPRPGGMRLHALFPEKTLRALGG